MLVGVGVYRTKKLVKGMEKWKSELGTVPLFFNQSNLPFQLKIPRPMIV